MDQNESKWIKMNQNESKWIKTNQNESKWIKTNQNESKWIKMNQTLRADTLTPSFIHLGAGWRVAHPELKYPTIQTGTPSIHTPCKPIIAQNLPKKPLGEQLHCLCSPTHSPLLTQLGNMTYSPLAGSVVCGCLGVVFGCIGAVSEHASATFRVAHGYQCVVCGFTGVVCGYLRLGTVCGSTKCLWKPNLTLQVTSSPPNPPNQPPRTHFDI